MASKTFTVTIAAATSTGTPQYPTLLAGYAHKPPFKVAGVDYYVGVPAGLALKLASASNLPAGASLSGGQILVSGDNVTLNGYDFGPNGYIYVNGANCRIVNSKIVTKGNGGSQQAVISGRGANLYIGYTTIDGMAGAGGTAEFLIDHQAAGLTIENCWLRRSNSDIVGRNGSNSGSSNGGSVILKNSFFEQAGLGGQDTHGDYLQVYGPNLDNIAITGCTAHQVGGITQGFFADNTKQGEIGNCVMIGSVNYWVSMSGPNTKPSTFTGTGFNVHDNYFDGGFGFAYPVASGPNPAKFTNNINLKTGGGP